jgi:hypothetical protein
MELGPAPRFSRADPRWSCWSWLCLADNFWSGVDSLDLELRGALPNTRHRGDVKLHPIRVILDINGKRLKLHCS